MKNFFKFARLDSQRSVSRELLKSNCSRPKPHFGTSPLGIGDLYEEETILDRWNSIYLQSFFCFYSQSSL